jgi:hypothetical protein
MISQHGAFLLRSNGLRLPGLEARRVLVFRQAFERLGSCFGFSLGDHPDKL